MIARLGYTLILMLTFLGAAPALAQTKPGRAVAQSAAEKAAAQAKFDEAQRLMARKKHAEACALLEESLKIDEAMAARFRLAECQEKTGRLASAWINYVDVADAAQAARLADRERFARGRARALEPRLIRLTIEVPQALSAVPGLEIRRNGEIVAPKLWNQPVPVDPGPHEIRVTAPGKLPWSGMAAAEIAGSTVPFPVGSLADDPAAKASSAGADSASAPGKAQRIAGLSLAGGGALGMIAAIAVGLAARGSYDGSAPHCSDDLCDATGLQIRARAREQGDIATAVFIAGAVVGVGGAVLWLTAPSAGPRPAVGLGVGAGHLTLKGTW